MQSLKEQSQISRTDIEMKGKEEIPGRTFASPWKDFSKYCSVFEWSVLLKWTLDELETRVGKLGREGEEPQDINQQKNIGKLLKGKECNSAIYEAELIIHIRTN